MCIYIYVYIHVIYTCIYDTARWGVFGAAMQARLHRWVHAPRSHTHTLFHTNTHTTNLSLTFSLSLSLTHTHQNSPPSLPTQRFSPNSFHRMDQSKGINQRVNSPTKPSVLVNNRSAICVGELALRGGPDAVALTDSV